MCCLAPDWAEHWCRPCFGRCRGTIRCTAGAIQTIPTHKSIQGCRCLKTNPTSNEDGAPSMYSQASAWLSSFITELHNRWHSSSPINRSNVFEVCDQMHCTIEKKKTGEVGMDQVIHQLIKAGLLWWIAPALSFLGMETSFVQTSSEYLSDKRSLKFLCFA